MKKIILASTSPRRRELLKKLNINFTVEASDYKEDMQKKMLPANLSKFLALNKAKAVAKKHNSGIIIGADTFVVFGNDLLGKPKNAVMARNMLKMISGKTLTVISGYAIIDAKTNKIHSGYSTAKVSIKKLSPKEISWYINTKEPLDKAGAFAVQGYGAVFIRKLEGDFFSVVGLPIYSLVQPLKKFGVNVI
ncbi:septum formation protein Maf [Patescibacteria group bacterium]|nr:septum formation protein Maf [Patescibacteria group bacterium]